MKIKFTANYKVQDAEGKEYAEGDVVDMSEASANHFINRGVAERHTATKTAKKGAKSAD